MKVYGTSHYFTDTPKGLHQARVVVSAKTKKRAAELFKMSMYTFNNYVAVTGNKTDIKLATAKPETVIIREVYGLPHSDTQTPHKYHIEQADMGCTICDKCGAYLDRESLHGRKSKAGL